MSKKIGIIGAGGMLEYHAAGFCAGGADLLAICDMNEKAALNELLETLNNFVDDRQSVKTVNPPMSKCFRALAKLPFVAQVPA